MHGTTTNRFKFSKLRDPILDALDAAITGTLPYYEPQSLTYPGRDHQRPLLDYTEEVFPACYPEVKGVAAV